MGSWVPMNGTRFGFRVLHNETHLGFRVPRNGTRSDVSKYREPYFKSLKTEI